MCVFTMTIGIFTLCFYLLVDRSQGYDIALWRPAFQSSSFNSVHNVSAVLAVDGNTNQRLSGNSCARTDFASEVWWRVDLGSVKSIYSIKVFFRNDSDQFVYNRVKAHAGFSLYISNTTEHTKGHLCYKNNVTLPPLLSEHVCIRHGRYVTYYNARGSGVVVPPESRPRTTIAELCEIQVFGCNATVYGDKCNKPCPDNCQEKHCDVLKGACLGCVAGWRGNHCDQICESSFYGEGCKHSCSDFCTARTCHHITGDCVCQPGWAGTNCSLNVTGNDTYTSVPINKGKTRTENHQVTIVVIGVCAAIVIAVAFVILIVAWKKLSSGKDEQGFLANFLFSTLMRKHADDDTLTEPDDFAYQNVALESENDEDDANVYDSISVSDLYKVIKMKSEDENAAFKKEYSVLPRGEQFPCDEAKKPDNVPRNRYKTTFPYDHSRVILQCSSGKESNYINANYLENVDGEKIYIATQGPKPSTVLDFWRMVWQENATKIVNVTNLKEGTKIKCEKYWPDRKQTLKKGEFRIQNIEETVYANYVIRKLKVTKKSSCDIRIVFMFHYTEWPDHDVPEALNLVLFHRHIMRTSQSQTKVPMIVHCSAGIGRTGTFIALDALYSHGTKTGKVNIPEYVKALRKDRMSMIQSHEQLRVVYETLHEAFRAKHSLVYKDEFINRYDDSLTSDMSESSSHLQTEFQELQDIKPTYTDSDFKTAKENLDLNFSQDVLPVDSYLCHLSYVKGQSNYYNAILLQSYTKPDALISAQFPAAESSEYLFRLIKDFEASILVALSPLTDMESVYTNSFLPQKQSSINVGSFTLTHKSTSKSTNVSKTSVVIKKKGLRDMQCEVFECPVWQTSHWMSDSRVMVDLVKEVKMSQYAQPNISIVVLSSDGASRTGTFCAVFNALEELTTDDEVDLFTIVRQLQIRRTEFFQHFMEYKFCHEVVCEYLRSDMVYENC
ncbi:receptor-type tyrosine-protein phosphatase kappa-like isoform X2 [Ostrea edulis]|uniref:receptor-type tyrosine-protein phosphatase kappa-like isoform X2 n=1 Tax=Ostrea edulis TaxID=37623 RepID=UPI0024AFE112|nr:receptor-type tyrosine-protein phosphatase kappa-like isoform X2 [Ostrea edulis]